MLGFSVNVNKKFKFINALAIVFILYHTETWYTLAYTCSNAEGETLVAYSYYAPLCINAMCLVVLAWPSLRPE